jgi:hypothetical protein
MIKIKRLKTTVNYPFDELVNLVENITRSVPLLMVGIKRHLIAPKVKVSANKIYVREPRIKAVYYPNKNGDTVVEYYYHIHWLVLILWIISIFPLLGGFKSAFFIVIYLVSIVIFFFKRIWFQKFILVATSLTLLLLVYKSFFGDIRLEEELFFTYHEDNLMIFLMLHLITLASSIIGDSSENKSITTN